ncbi:TIGR02996 domain-containing protein [Pyxidicoccus trucidator]|uniref:TIGR02996 domain-containing protein n=1 Tax=Pyxidicoccus trucidator TaxID=2709662 RepID=UPI0013DAE9B0|nr:TIGR02996 domain-containing protein [Pyxidicoccus trucidator]
MSDTVAGLLERAREAFERHAYAEVLQRLLEAWEKTHAERIALLAEQLSELADAGDAPHVGRLGQSRKFEALAKNAGPEDARSVARALDALLGGPADPRLIPALLQLAALPIAQVPGVGRRLLNVLGHVKDPRTLDPLRAVHASLPRGSPLEFKLETVIEFLAEQPVPTLEAEASALCGELEEAIARRAEILAWSRGLREALLARVLDSPDDDGARLVLADHLLELGDPQGELISLQCAPRPDETRIEEVLKEHRATWEGMLGPGVVPGDTWFERGFPHAVRMMVQPWQRLPPPGPFWRTMREMDWCWTGADEAADWLAHPHLSGVTVLWQVPPDMASRLGQYPLPVRRLELCVGPHREPEGLFRSLASLPHLVHLELVCSQRGDEVLLCADSPLAPRLERFDVLSPDSWSLTAVPSAEVPVEATVVNDTGAVRLMRVLSQMTCFGTRALRIHSRYRLDEDLVRQMRGATLAYERVEWNMPPG